MKRSEVNEHTKVQLKKWMEDNKGPGVLPCIPIILINSLTGDKPGISMNLARIPLPDIVNILKAATTQVELKIKELEQN